VNVGKFVVYAYNGHLVYSIYTEGCSTIQRMAHNSYVSINNRSTVIIDRSNMLSSIIWFYDTVIFRTNFGSFKYFNNTLVSEGKDVIMSYGDLEIKPGWFFNYNGEEPPIGRYKGLICNGAPYGYYKAALKPLPGFTPIEKNTPIKVSPGANTAIVTAILKSGPPVPKLEHTPPMIKNPEDLYNYCRTTFE
jgi:hypothetical protein